MRDVAARPLIELTGVCKRYSLGAGTFSALTGISLQVNAGEFVAVVGRSGSGKTTLMNVMAGIDRSEEGLIRVNGIDINGLNESHLARWRGKNIGIVFQSFQLLPTLTIIENVMLPMDFCHTYPARGRRALALALLNKLGISEQADKLPAALSGGQQQRAAIARALANNPPIILADEPTGNLDSETTGTIMQLFAQLVAEGKTILMVTHERDFVRYFHRIISLKDGQLEGAQYA